MNIEFDRIRYNHNLGYRVLHITGMNAGETALPFLHHCFNYMLMYFKEGSGRIRIEGNRYNLDAGDLIILNPSELFQITVDDGIFHERVTINLSEAMFAFFSSDQSSLFVPFFKRKKGMGNRTPAELIKKHGIDNHIESILKHLQSSDSSSPILAFCKIVEMLACIKESVSSDLLKESGQILSNPLIEDVLKYLNSHFKEDINISDIAQKLNINKSYLSHLFKEHVGMGLCTYVTFRRIQLFNTLIKENDSIEDTCYEVGFQNYSNFFRLYKKYMKMTPSQFKRQIKSGEKLIDINS